MRGPPSKGPAGLEAGCSETTTPRPLRAHDELVHVARSWTPAVTALARTRCSAAYGAHRRRAGPRERLHPWDVAPSRGDPADSRRVPEPGPIGATVARDGRPDGQRGELVRRHFVSTVDASAG